MKLTNQCVLVTGASGGIGAEVAKTLSSEGACLLLTGRDEDKLNALTAELEGEGHLAYAADLSRDPEREALVDFAIAQNVSMLVNVAGVNELALLAEMSGARIEQMMQLNLTVPMLLCRDLSEHLSRQPHAAIVNVGSILGSIGYAGSSVYCAAKFGLRGFTESLRRELADTPVQVIYVAPRATATAMNSDAMTRMNEALGVAVDDPKTVARQVMAAIRKHQSRHYYLGWPERFFVWLNALFPSVVDGALNKQLSVIRRFAAKQHS